MDLKNEVSSDCYFYLANGKVIKSVPELLEEIRKMEEWVFEYHVNSQKNDFLNWIEFLARK